MAVYKIEFVIHKAHTRHSTMSFLSFYGSPCLKKENKDLIFFLPDQCKYDIKVNMVYWLLK